MLIRLKTALFFTTLSLCLAACGGPDVIENAVQVIIPAADLTQSGNRIPFILYDGPEPVRDAQSVSIQLVDITASEPKPLDWVAEAENYSDYAVPYWVIHPPFPSTGLWGVQATVTLADGTLTISDFVVDIKAESAVAAIGSAAPLSENMTIADQPDLALLTSDWEPEPALYDLTVAEAVASGKPTIVSFATPAFCQTIFCAPVINSFKASYATHGADVNYIHIEVFENFSDIEDFADLEYVPEMAEWGLPSEPWMFIIDADGIITHQLQGPVSETEITQALDSLN